MATQADDPKPQSAASRFLENLLIGTVEAVARAGAKAVESLTDDAAKAIDIQKKKVQATRDAVRAWRKQAVGEIDSDIPASLRED
jgi:hypothetical protein